MIPAHLKRRQAERLRDARATPMKRSADGAAPLMASPLLQLMQQHATSVMESYAAKDAPALRKIARENARANPFMKRIMDVWEQNAWGPTGLTVNAAPRNSRGGVNEALKEALERAWYEDFCPTADVRGGSFDQAMRFLVRAKPRDGEGVIELVEDPRMPFGFGVRVLDCDLIDWDYTTTVRTETRRVVRGVELDDVGRPVAYHILSHHKRDAHLFGAPVRRRVPADRIRLYMHRESPESVRGVPVVTPALVRMDMLNGAQEALVLLHRVAASKMGFFVASADAHDGIAADAGSSVATMGVQPGLAEQLNPGWDFKPWDPGQPGDNYGELSKGLREEMAVAAGMTTVSLTGDLSEANYGSMRHGELMGREAWRVEHTDLAGICQWVWQRFVRAAAVRGLLPLSGLSVEEMSRAEWYGRTWPWIDPLKDAQGMALLIANKLTSPQEVLNAQGKDWKKVYAEIAEAQQFADSLGIRDAVTAATQPDAGASPTRGLKRVG